LDKEAILLKQTNTLYLVATVTFTTMLFTGCMQKQQTQPDETHTPLNNAVAHTETPAQAAATTPASDQPTLHMRVDVKSNSAIVHFDTTRFKISPEHYSQAHVPGEGHIHLFLDGNPTKIAVKENTYQLKDLAKGKHQLKASLHTNNHQPYNVEDTIEFEIK
jgi:hypothetical protein